MSNLDPGTYGNLGSPVEFLGPRKRFEIWSCFEMDFVREAGLQIEPKSNNIHLTTRFRINDVFEACCLMNFGVPDPLKPSISYGRGITIQEHRMFAKVFENKSQNCDEILQKSSQTPFRNTL